MDALNRLKALMEQPRKVLLTSHRNPDGDAIGSMLGLYHLLRKRGHEVAMAVPSAFPEFLDWMPGVDQILIHDDQAEACSPVADGAEVVFYLDFNDIERIDKLGELCHATEAFKVMIDHHLEPQEGIVDYMLSVPSASSTCELVWDFIHLMGWQDQIDCRVAECLFT
ncbi:MAG: bifunctional oligoribonuclease/PAP phosphatase NrnA, partial [Bacteroidetes bacterium]